VRSVTKDFPSGPIADLNWARSVVLTQPNDPFSLTSLTDTFSVNGRPFTRVYDAASGQLSTTTPEGRQTVTVLDTMTGRVTQVGPPGVLPAQFGYDARGRLETITQGTRTWTLAYDVQGNLATVTDPLSHVISFEYDLAGRATKQTFPDLREVLFGYDESGNVTGITPPGRPLHAFAFTPIDLEESYLPPAVPGPLLQTVNTYNHDRQLTRVTRPDGGTIELTYGPVAGQLFLQTLPAGEGQLTYQYDPVTGQLSGISGPDTETLAFTYTGPLPATTTWSGPVAGSVTHTYDADLRVSTEQVNAANAATFTYDGDSLLRQASLGGAALDLERDPQSGRISTTSLGTVSDTYAYNTYGELESYSASAGASPLYEVRYVRDALRRIADDHDG